jgi:hypothetical protein
MAKVTKEKASKALKNTADFTTDNLKPILIVGGIAIAAYLVYKVVTKVGNGIPDLGNHDGAGGGNPSTTGGNSVPYGATITPNQAQAIASGLYEATMQWGTDEQKIFSLLTGKTAKDYALISEAFGKPRYDGVAEAYWPFPERNLTYILNSELSASDFIKLKSLMPGVL